MHSSATKHLLLVVVVTCSLLSVSVMTTTHAIDQPAHQSVNRPTCIPHERDALLAFKQGITSDPAGLLDSWKLGDQGEQDSCRWRGVQCSSLTGHVSELRLSGYSDGGKLLVGQISPSLLTLEYLEHLDLSFSRLEGSTGHIPKFLGSFKNLRYLDLSSIPFLGILPPELGNLSKLQYLDLSAFEFGYTNSTDISWLTRLSSLQQLALGFVDLSAVASWAHVVNMIPSLRAIDLSSCSLVSPTTPLA
nr:unnamed protein product [Digitaria exilis]